MPRVSIEDDAFGDGRYDRLAHECGLADADHARGKMARLWRQCTAEKRYQLDPEDVILVLGPRGPDALVIARLGDRVDGGIRIRGTKGRIEWLEKLRKNGKKGGRPKKPTRKPNGSPSGSGESNPPAPAPAPAGSPESLSPPRAAPEQPTEPAPVVLPPAAVPFAPGLRLVALAVDLLNAARAKLDPTAQPITADQGDETALMGHLRGLPEEKREAAIRHGVAVIAESVLVGKDPISALRFGELVGPRSWRKWQAATVESIRSGGRGRDGPGGPRSPPRGQAPPAARHGIGPIED